MRDRKPTEAPEPRRVELRSDTFSLPTSEMVQAMVGAELGDELYREDPTVRQLELMSARMLGKAASCFMPSETMSNLAAILTHCPRGSMVVLGEQSDIYIYESSAAAVCGGVMYHPVPNQPDGTMDLADIEAAFPPEPEDPQLARPALLCLENPQNHCGGRVLPTSHLEAVASLARERGLAVHLDGSRVFNASLSSQVPVDEITGHADSVQFSLYKGLGAPIGSMLVGSETFIERARRVRNMLGGGMRQAGVMAAAGIVALKNRGRLAHDHETARHLAYGLAKIPGISIDPTEVEMNLVFFRVGASHVDLHQFMAAARARGVALTEVGPGRIRAVTHHGVDLEDIDYALAVIRSIVDDQSPRPRPVPNRPNRRNHADRGPALAG